MRLSRRLLTQLSVSAALLGLLAAAIAVMLTSQNNENLALGEKLAANDLARVVSQALANGSVCESLFDPENVIVGRMPFDATGMSPVAPVTLALKKITHGLNGDAIAEDGGPASALSRTLALSSAADGRPGLQVEITSLAPPTATLHVNFDQKRLVRPIPDLKFPMTLQAAGPLKETKLTGCRVANFSSQLAVFATPGTTQFIVPDGVHQLHVEIWGGGGGGCGGLGGSGGGGGYTRCLLAVSQKQVYKVTVGAGGAAGAKGCSAASCDCGGGPGGDSSLSGPNGSSQAACSSTGGAAGSSGGGAGGQGTTAAQTSILGFINLNGGDGSDLDVCAGTRWVARGGAAPRGGDGGGARQGGAGTLSPGTAPGGGGPASCWGAGTGRAGHGAPGAVHISW